MSGGDRRDFGEVRGVVEAAQEHPAVGERNEPGDRAVVGMDERERAARRRLTAQLADHAAVDEGRGDAAMPGRLDDGVQPGADPFGEHVHRLGVRDDVPALALEHLQEARVALRGADAHLAALPVAELDLAQVGDGDGLEPRPPQELGGRLARALQRRDEDGVRRVGGQPLAHRAGLGLALLGERRVGVTLDELEALARDGGLGGAVADEEDLRGVGRRGEGALGVAVAHGGHASVAAVPEAALPDPEGAVIDADGPLLDPEGALLDPEGALLGPEAALLGPEAALLAWYAREARDLPWRRTRDP